MSVSITTPVGPYTEGFIGNRRFTTRNVKLDNNYQAGGYGTAQGFNAAGLGLGGYTLKGMSLESINGPGSASINAYLDNSTGKLVCARDTGSTLAPLIIEETVALTANTTGKLANVPAVICAISSTTNVLKQIPVGKTPLTKQVAVNYLTGAITALASDAFTSLLFSYIPLGTGPFIAANRVIDEAVTLASAGVNLANQAALIEYVYDITDAANTRPPIVGKTMTPATHTIQINLANASATTLTSNAAQNGDSALVTYWKNSAFPIGSTGNTAQANIATTGGNTLLSMNTFAGIVIPCFGPCLVGVVAGPTFIEEVMAGPSGTVAANKPVWNPLKGTFTFNGADAAANIELGFMILGAGDSLPTNELNTGFNLSGVTIRATFFAV